MISVQDWADVAAVTPDLPDTKLLQVLSLIDRLPDEERPQPVLEAMRPRLKELRPPRRLTVQRLLFKPMEDLFDAPEFYQRHVGRLSRRTIRPIWTLLTQRADPALLEEVGAELVRWAAGDGRAIELAGARLWPSAADILTVVVADAARDRRQHIQWFGRDEDTLRQVEDAVAVLRIGSEIEAVKALLPPRPIPQLSDAQAETVSAVVLRVAGGGMDRLRTFILVLAARLSRPGDLLDILEALKSNPAIKDQEALVRDIETSMVENIVRQAQHLEQHGHGRDSAVTLSRLAESLVGGLLSLQEKLRRRGNKHLNQQLRSARTGIGQTLLGSVIETADDTMEAMLNQRGDTLTDDQMLAAEEFALALRRCAVVAPAVGIERQVSAKLTAIQADLQRRGLQRADDPAEDQQRLVESVRLVELMVGPDEAERLLTQGLDRLSAR